MITLQDIHDMVEEYATVSGQEKDPELSAGLVYEEYIEWEDEVFDRSNHNPEAELKELADLVYVAYGRARTMGYQLNRAIDRVHENNMGRMKQPDGTIKRREDGKIIKNPEYPAVDLGDLV